MFKIGIDLDNTVADYIRGVGPLIKEEYGLEPDYTKDAYSIEEVFGITPETRPEGMHRKLYVEKRAFKHLPPLEPDNHGLTLELKSKFDPCKVYFVTARDPHPVIVKDTRDWLDRNTGYYDDVFHTGQKADFCRAAGISVMIEDEVRQIVSLLSKGINVVIMDQPWNQQVPLDPQVIEVPLGRALRVDNWEDAVLAAEEFYHASFSAKKHRRE